MTANPAPLPISATVICKNEEACIGKCLESLAGLAEIVVVDSGSTDGTLAVVEDFARRGLPIRLIRRDWPGYARQKQFALDEARDLWTCPHRHRGWSAVDRARACAVKEARRRLRDGTRG